MAEAVEAGLQGHRVAAVACATQREVVHVRALKDLAARVQDGPVELVGSYLPARVHGDRRLERVPQVAPMRERMLACALALVPVVDAQRHRCAERRGEYGAKQQRTRRRGHQATLRAWRSPTASVSIPHETIRSGCRRITAGTPPTASARPRTSMPRGRQGSTLARSSMTAAA